MPKTPETQNVVRNVLVMTENAERYSMEGDTSNPLGLRDSKREGKMWKFTELVRLNNWKLK